MHAAAACALFKPGVEAVCSITAIPSLRPASVRGVALSNASSVVGSRSHRLCLTLRPRPVATGRGRDILRAAPLTLPPQPSPPPPRTPSQVHHPCRFTTARQRGSALPGLSETAQFSLGILDPFSGWATDLEFQVLRSFNFPSSAPVFPPAVRRACFISQATIIQHASSHDRLPPGAPLPAGSRSHGNVGPLCQGYLKQQQTPAIRLATDAAADTHSLRSDRDGLSYNRARLSV